MNDDSGVLYGIVDLSDNSTVVYAGPCYFIGAIVTTITSAHVCPIQDGTSVIAATIATAPVGTEINGHRVRCATNLTVDPHDDATGIMVVYYEPNHFGLAGSGAGLPA